MINDTLPRISSPRSDPEEEHDLSLDPGNSVGYVVEESTTYSLWVGEEALLVVPWVLGVVLGLVVLWLLRPWLSSEIFFTSCCFFVFLLSLIFL